MINELLDTYELNPYTSAPIEETIALTYMPNSNRLNFSEIVGGLVDVSDENRHNKSLSCI